MAGWREPHWPYRTYDQKPLSARDREIVEALQAWADKALRLAFPTKERAGGLTPPSPPKPGAVAL